MNLSADTAEDHSYQKDDKNTDGQRLSGQISQHLSKKLLPA